MPTKQPATPRNAAAENPSLNEAIHEYVRAYALWHGRPQAALRFGVSCHTLWRFLERGHLGRSLPRAVTGALGDDPQAIDAATEELIATALRERRLLKNIDDALAELEQRGPAGHRLSNSQEDALLLLCAAPLATAQELARFGRVPESTMRDRLNRLADRGLVDSVSHSQPNLGSRPQLRYFPTDQGVMAAAQGEKEPDRFLSAYPVSRQWFRILTERLDAVAVVYHVAALLADADATGQPVRVDHYRQGPYDALVTLSQGRTLGIIRQGATLPSPNLRYRLRTAENLPYREQPEATLVLACSDQANRRAVRTLGHPTEHRFHFVATEGEQLAGDHRAVAWQQCGNGMADVVTINPHLSLADILARVGSCLDRYAAEFRVQTPKAQRQPKPNPDTLYSSRLQSLMPDPAGQVKDCLAVRLTSAQKQALDLLAAWPLCTTEQFAGLMGGVTRRWAKQIIQSLSDLSLVREERGRHILSDDGLRHLARRDRLAVRMALGRWSARRRRRSRGGPLVYSGTALRSLASQQDHQDAIATTSAMFTAEAARSRDYQLLEMLPTHRSSVGYYFQGQYYVVHPDATFWLAYRGKWRPYFIEVERRAVTPKRVRERLRNYRRYFASNWPKRDHGGALPLVLFVFETPEVEEAFVDSAGYHNLPICTSDLELFEERGVLGEVWRPPHPDTCQRMTIHCLDKLRLVHKAVPRTSGRGAVNQRDPTVTNLLRPQKPGRAAFCCRTADRVYRPGRPKD